MFLEKITGRKRAYIEQRRDYYERLRKKARRQRSSDDFSRALSCPGASVIAEIKKASPSAGTLTEKPAAALAEAYSKAGADAVSVVTEGYFFKGDISDIRAAKEFFKGPVLMKDFVISPLQVAEAVCSGASAVLLIAETLTGKDLGGLLRCCEDYGIESLVELHGYEQIEKCLNSGARIIGVNSRNLSTLEVDPDNAFRLIEHIPESLIRVAESGISTRDQVVELSKAGYDAFLVGSSILGSSDPVKKISLLKTGKLP